MVLIVKVLLWLQTKHHPTKVDNRQAMETRHFSSSIVQLQCDSTNTGGSAGRRLADVPAWPDIAVVGACGAVPMPQVEPGYSRTQV